LRSAVVVRQAGRTRIFGESRFSGVFVSRWVKLTNVATALEADMLVEHLRAARIPAVARGNDIVGIFGPGFGGATARGVDVFVPSIQLHSARQILADYRGEDR
jgi:hypothetical protein